ncbi:hypothetical protein [Cellulomonas sp. Leaf334]|uniref:hypothetical protein n=1 Tax=Cellulomonas sp. Leaf334 TaxID=1736339 RepID=UPI000A67354D|nr:hypothetical protein [Cellulomonas sp. Leaf334]
MSEDRETPRLDGIRRVKQYVEDDLLSIPGITGVSVGYKYVNNRKTEQIAIRVYVEQKRDVPESERIPSSFDVVPTDVIERRFLPLSLAEAAPMLFAAEDVNRYEPLTGGISIGPCRDPLAGTLGMIVSDVATGQAMALSNFHVLAVDNGFTVGDNIVQPALADNGVCPQDVVAVLSRAILDNGMDAAVASIAGRSHECRIEGLGAVTETRDAMLGMAVRKRGRSTRLTTGEIDSIDATFVIPYVNVGEVTLSNQIEVAADTPRIVVDPGYFIAAEWTTAPVTISGEVTVVRSTNGPAPGVTVTGPTGSIFHQTISTNNTTYTVFGDPPAVLVRETQTTPGPINTSVTVVNLSTSPPSEQLVLMGYASNSAVPPPTVQFSQGTGSAFLIYSSNGTEVQHLAICRSRDGRVLCAGPSSFVPNTEIRAEATADSLRIHYSLNAGPTVCSTLPGLSTEPFSLPGDSGSVIVDANNSAIGLLFGGSIAVVDPSGETLSPEGVFAAATPIDIVLAALGVRLCTSGGGSGGGIGGGAVPEWTRLSVRALAARCLGSRPPISLRRDIFRSSEAPVLSLRSRLVQINRQCR